jgi:hypothetical protein
MWQSGKFDCLKKGEMTPQLTIIWTALSDDQSTKGNLNLPDKDLWEGSCSYCCVNVISNTHYFAQQWSVSERTGSAVQFGPKPNLLLAASKIKHSNQHTFPSGLYYRGPLSIAHLQQQCHNHSSVTTTTVSQPQKCHNHNSVTTTTVSQPQQCHNYNSVTTTAVSQLQQCHNHNSVTTTTVSQPQQCHNYNSVTTTTVSQLKMCDFLFFFFEGF